MEIFLKYNFRITKFSELQLSKDLVGISTRCLVAYYEFSSSTRHAAARNESDSDKKELK